MPPRIPVCQCLRVQSTHDAALLMRTFSTTSSQQASTSQRRKHRDPYAIAQAKARKAANLSRQEVLKQERAGTLGHPVRGVETPFLKSFDTALTDDADAAATPHEAGHLNFFLNRRQLNRGIAKAEWLLNPSEEGVGADADVADEAGAIGRDRELDEVLGITASEKKVVSPPANPKDDYLPYKEYQERRTQLHCDHCGKQGHTQDDCRQLHPEKMGAHFQELDEARQGREAAKEEAEQAAKLHPFPWPSTPAEPLSVAAQALSRIAALSLGSSKDRLRVNKQRCISTFGRHNTDTLLPPKPPGLHAPPPPEHPKERVGPDTGSSEVQVAILTAKIRTLADFVMTRGRTDRVNQRNLRLLVHKRQKLLNYVRRKERGGPRWENLISKLGLTEATWKGEITLGRADYTPVEEVGRA